MQPAVSIKIEMQHMKHAPQCELKNPNQSMSCCAFVLAALVVCVLTGESFQRIKCRANGGSRAACEV
eukprot:11866-Heterococcus_DN1.PRE.2